MGRPQFEADLEPSTMFPRIRFNFDNGWTASLIVCAGAGETTGIMASVAACPTGQWETGEAEIGETEASADEAIAWVNSIRDRPPIERNR